MNKKIVISFTAFTFLLAIVCWGICAAFGLIGYTIENAAWLWVIVAIAGLSPTIASYIVLKKNNKISGFKEWLNNVFYFKHPFCLYLLVIILSAVSFIPQFIINGFGEALPFYMIFAMMPVVLLFGGLEEAGWRYILQPGLDKKYGYILSSFIVAVIWTAWHIPVLLPQGRIESLSWLGLYALGILGSSFVLGAISRITNSVFLCVLFHSIGNLISSMVDIGENLTLFESVVSNILLIVVSIVAVMISDKRKTQLVKK